MSLSSTRSWFQLGIWGLALVFVLSLFETTDAFAARRRGRGVRRGGAARVRAGGRRRGRGRPQQARRGVRRGGNRGVAALPANGAGVNNNNLNQNLDAGPASVNPAALGQQGIQGLQPVNGFNNLGRDSRGNFFELNPGSVVNGAFVVNTDDAVRQALLGTNGNIIAGSQGQMLPGTQAQVRAFNNGEIPVSGFPASASNSGGGSSQVISLRR